MTLRFLALLLTVLVGGVGAHGVALGQAVCITRQELTARGPGIVQKYHVASGQQVKKGDAIVEFDARQLKAGLKEAQGASEAARANEDLASDAVSRLEKLKSSESVTEQQLVEARVRLAQARAVRKQAEGAVERVRVQVQDTIIRAEVAGTVQGLPTILGMGVQPGQSLGRIEAQPASCPTPMPSGAPASTN